jgi:predicted Co/Zn/Cd cation transporter (cation efflux family)
MAWLFDGIADWLHELLVNAVMASFAGMFGMVNDQVTDIAVQVGQTPTGWNAGVFAMVRTLSETVVLPIAGMILTFVLCYELIHMIIERNNMHEDVLCRGRY